MTTLTRAIPNKTVVVLCAAIALVAITFGVAQVMRSPDPQFVQLLPTTPVTLQDGRKLNVQTREVTVQQWQACHHAGFCTLDLSSAEKDEDYPATGLSYPDVMQYVAWLNSQSNVAWRLPTAAEWFEMAAEVMPEKPDPIFTDPSLTWASTYLTEASRTGRALRPSGAFSATSTGVEDLDGNVWEWTQDCYAGASGQGANTDITRCPAFVMGGEHEAVMSYLVRDPARGGCAVGAPPAHLGMRLVSEAS
ncbi:MAG: formylglycine-generating enzyme family protein [Sulfitobacter sp.]